MVAASAVWLSAVQAVAQPRQAQPAPPTFEQKMAWMLRLEDQRILRAAEPPPQAADFKAPGRSKSRGQAATPPLPPAPDLIRLLDDPEGRVRRRAALAIGRVGLAEGVLPLAKVLVADRDAEVRQMAAFALGVIGHRSAVEPLRSALRDPSALVQGRAAEALGLVGDTASAQAIATMAASNLASVKAAALESDDLSYPLAPPIEAFRLGIYALTRLKAPDALLSVVLDPSGQPRLAWWPVAFALSRTEDARVVPALVTLARTGGSISRAFAARGLGARKAEAGVGTLIQLTRDWRTDPRPAVAAIRALAQIGGSDAAAPLRALVQEGDVEPNVRLEAVAALGALRDHASLDTLLDGVGDPWPALRAASLRAIKEIDLETFVVVLSGLDPDPHPSVRAAVVSMLPALGAERALPKLQAVLAGRDTASLPAAMAAMLTLPDKPRDFTPTLLALLAGGDVMVRAAAASAIGDLKPDGGDRALAAAGDLTGGEGPRAIRFGRNGKLALDTLMSAFAWKSSDLQNVRDMAQTGNDPIASLGYDGPLAALSNQRQNLSDYFKEQVAVVTNPAIDRER